ncbi:GNAT family N-acetyltransferase [[Mycoplasma] cavipharyngis]|uniref:GNAT family N-acetyltransferase n=1 Tax=[Mycoplasma] cavipharyngis TaxID=92757 RepID=UPI003704D420
MKQYKFLVDDVQFRMVKEEDIPAIFAYGQKPVVVKFLPWGPVTSIKETEAFYQSVKDDTNVWSILYKRKMIGTVSCVKISHENKHLFIGYVIDNEYWNLGIGLYAVKIFLAYLKEKYPDYQIYAEAVKHNYASINLLLKAGFCHVSDFNIIQKNKPTIKSLFQLK